MRAERESVQQEITATSQARMRSLRLHLAAKHIHQTHRIWASDGRGRDLRYFSSRPSIEHEGCIEVVLLAAEGEVERMVLNPMRARILEKALEVGLHPPKVTDMEGGQWQFSFALREPK